MNKTAIVLLSLLCIVLTGCTLPSEEKSDMKSKQEIVSENILSRRSIRKYKNMPIDSTVMREILNCGINAPNGQGRESWEVRVVADSRFMQEIDSVYNEYIVSADQQAKTYRPAAYGAPILVFIACDTTYDMSQVDCGLLGGNMILSANSMGIGSCCLGGLCRFVNSEAGESILKQLNIPSTHRLLYAISFGYPDEKPAAKKRNWDKIQFIRK